MTPTFGSSFCNFALWFDTKKFFKKVKQKTPIKTLNRKKIIEN